MMPSGLKSKPCELDMSLSSGEKTSPWAFEWLPERVSRYASLLA